MSKKLFKGKWEIPDKPIKEGENEVGQRVKLFRKIRFMNGMELAAQINISQGSLSEIENGINLPSANTLRNLYYAGCDINWLLTGDDT